MRRPRLLGPGASDNKCTDGPSCQLLSESVASILVCCTRSSLTTRSDRPVPRSSLASTVMAAEATCTSAGAVSSLKAALRQFPIQTGSVVGGTASDSESTCSASPLESASSAEQGHSEGYSYSPSTLIFGRRGPSMFPVQDLTVEMCGMAPTSPPGLGPVASPLSWPFSSLATSDAVPASQFLASTVPLAPPTCSSSRRCHGGTSQRRLNAEIMEAAKAAPDEVVGKILDLVQLHVLEMNAVNISTAMHRLVRACRASPADANKVRGHPAVRRMIDVTESLAEKELKNASVKLPAKCCTIIAWSCSSLRLFRGYLLSLLASVAARNLSDCDSFEITNLLWALAEACRRWPELRAELRPSTQELVHATARVFRERSMSTLKFHLLASALMSLVLLPSVEDLAQERLVVSIALELAGRPKEDASQNSTSLTCAFQTMEKQRPVVFEDVLHTCRLNFPGFTQQYVLRRRAAKEAQK